MGQALTPPLDSLGLSWSAWHLPGRPSDSICPVVPLLVRAWLIMCKTLPTGLKFLHHPSCIPGDIYIVGVLFTAFQWFSSLPS